MIFIRLALCVSFSFFSFLVDYSNQIWITASNLTAKMGIIFEFLFICIIQLKCWLWHIDWVKDTQSSLLSHLLEYQSQKQIFACWLAKAKTNCRWSFVLPGINIWFFTQAIWHQRHRRYEREWSDGSLLLTPWPCHNRRPRPEEQTVWRKNSLIKSQNVKVWQRRRVLRKPTYHVIFPRNKHTYFFWQSQGFQRYPELLKLQQDSNGLYRIYLENLAKISFSHMGFQHLEKKVP